MSTEQEVCNHTEVLERPQLYMYEFFITISISWHTQYLF